MSLEIPGGPSNWVFPATINFICERDEWIEKAKRECSEFVFVSMSSGLYSPEEDIGGEDVLRYFDESEWLAMGFSSLELKWTNDKEKLEIVASAPSCQLIFLRKSKVPHLTSLAET
jgi:hypothetical protein